MYGLINCRLIIIVLASGIGLFGPCGVNGDIKVVNSIVPILYDTGTLKQINDNPPTGYEPENWPQLREDTKTAVQAKAITLEESGFTGASKKLEFFNIRRQSGLVTTAICGLWAHNKPMVVLVVQDGQEYKAGDIIVEDSSVMQ